jgi:hypothetical protein
VNDDFENDELLRQLRAEDPVAGDRQGERAGERDRVRHRLNELLESDARSPRWSVPSGRPRLAIGATVAALAVGAALVLIIGGSSTGPAPALAIDKGPRWVTLTLKDPAASDAEMNQELADAGIDRVRMRSVPGPPHAVGTWAGYLLLGPFCQGTHFVNDVHVPSSSKRPATRATIHRTKGRFDLAFPRHSGVLIGVLRHPPGPHSRALRVGGLRVVKIPAFSKSTVRVGTASVDDPGKTAKVLVAIRPKSPDEPPEANDIGVDQLTTLGGVFADYGHAIEKGDTACSEFGLKPLSTLRPRVMRVRQLSPARRHRQLTPGSRG